MDNKNKNNIKEEIKRDALILYNWTKDKTEKQLNENQELLLQVLRIIKNPEARNKLQKYKSIIGSGIIKELEEKAKATLSKASEMRFKGEIFSNQNESIHPLYVISSFICKELNISDHFFSLILCDYLASEKSLSEAMLSNGFLEKEGSFKYKTMFEIRYAFGYPAGLCLKIYKDTTPRKIKEFIDKYWRTVVENQIFLPKYPHGRKRNTFKRDFQIYLLHIQENNSKQIANTLNEENLMSKTNISDSEKDKYTPSDSNIRKIICEIEKLLQENQVLQKMI